MREKTFNDLFSYMNIYHYHLVIITIMLIRQDISIATQAELFAAE